MLVVCGFCNSVAYDLFLCFNVSFIVIVWLLVVLFSVSVVCAYLLVYCEFLYEFVAFAFCLGFAVWLVLLIVFIASGVGCLVVILVKLSVVLYLVLICLFGYLGCCLVVLILCLEL